MKENNLTEWVNKYTDDMYSWAFYKVSNQEIARDLVQDTFLAAAEKISNFEGKSSPKTWLFSILNYKIIDYYRAKLKMPFNTDSDSLSMYFDENGEWRKDKKPADWDIEENNLLDDENFIEILKICLELLPSNWNACVKMKYLLGKSGAEICQQMDISKNNYWQIIHRAKLKLRECMESKWLKDNR